jgi:PIN domain nuclease of toxin-antitoxin system
LLLDTHAVLWFDAGDERLSGPARALMEDPANEVFISHVSAWELAFKLSLGKLTLRVPYPELFPGVLVANGFLSLQPRFEHYQAPVDLPFHHRDPFDRLLVAQAKAEGLMLVTCDTNLARYGISLAW